MKRPPDMSRRQFDAALKRRGWRKVLVWIDLGNGHSVGAVYRRGGKLDRRATLAHAVKRSDEEAAKRERAASIEALSFHTDPH